MAKKGNNDVWFPNSNLELYGFGLDINGNNVVRLRFPNSRGFSIQMANNLPETYYIASCYGWETKKLAKEREGYIKKIEKEVVSYIKKYGSDTQKKKLRIYN